jgi:SPP1 family predicted phage head-tail adaptor
MPAAGSYDRRIFIDQAPKPWPKDAAGQRLPSFVLAMDLYAKVIHLEGRELFAAQQFSAKTTTEFRVRYGSNVKAVTPDEQWRIRYEGRSYDITASRERTEAGRRREWSIFGYARAEGAAA